MRDAWRPPRAVGDSNPVRSEWWRNDRPAPAIGATKNSRTTSNSGPGRKAYSEGMGRLVNSSIYNPEDSRRVTANSNLRVPRRLGALSSRSLALPITSCMRNVILALAVLLASKAASAQAVVHSDAPRTIAVNGAADVKVTPDRVVLTLGILSRGATLDAVKADNDTRTKKVLAYLREAGLAGGQVRTDFLAINPNLDWGATDRRYTYDVRRNVIVTLNDVSQFERVLNGVLAHGVDNVISVRFMTSKLKDYRDQARALAIQAARAKAEKLCAELGVRPGPVQSIEEGYSGDSWGWDWWSWYWGGSGGSQSQVQVSMPSSGGQGDGFDTLALGEIPVSASVRVTFLLK